MSKLKVKLSTEAIDGSVVDAINHMDAIPQDNPNDPVVGLFGTCAESKWRDEIIPLLKCNYFNPVVDDWNEEAQVQEDLMRKTASLIAFTITPELEGFYSFVEMTQLALERPSHVVICFLEKYGDKSFNASQIKSIEAISKLMDGYKVPVLDSLEELAKYINLKVPSKSSSDISK